MFITLWDINEPTHHLQGVAKGMEFPALRSVVWNTSWFGGMNALRYELHQATLKSEGRTNSGHDRGKISYQISYQMLSKEKS